MKASYADTLTSFYATDALSGAESLEPGSVHAIVCSPPYFRLRQYLSDGHPRRHLEIGAEEDPQAYVDKLVAVFEALSPALRDDGTMWVVVGSSYAGSWGNQGRRREGERGFQRPVNTGRIQDFSGWGDMDQKTHTASWVNHHPQFKPKDLVPVPWMLGLELQRAGWYLRSDCIWAKPNSLPSSVNDRPTLNHEYVLLFSKSPAYFYDAYAIREPHSPESLARAGRGRGESHKHSGGAPGQSPNTLCADMSDSCHPAGRNKRSVWEVPIRPYRGSHYATFPPQLAATAIRAATPEYGVCDGCGGPYGRLVSYELRPDARAGGGAMGGAGRERNSQKGAANRDGREFMEISSARSVGWEATCACEGEGIVPATVLDPFAGSGTTLEAARKLGRRSIGFDIDEEGASLLEARLGYQEVLF